MWARRSLRLRKLELRTENLEPEPRTRTRARTPNGEPRTPGGLHAAANSFRSRDSDRARPVRDSIRRVRAAGGEEADHARRLRFLEVDPGDEAVGRRGLA